MTQNSTNLTEREIQLLLGIVEELLNLSREYINENTSEAIRSYGMRLMNRVCNAIAESDEDGIDYGDYLKQSARDRTELFGKHLTIVKGLETDD